MNRSPISALLVPAQDTDYMNVVDTPALYYWIRPLSLGMWVFAFGVQVLSLVSTGETNWLLLGLMTLLFIGVQVQFWFEESRQGLVIRQSVERLRGEVFEDDLTGLPNSRHFLSELRRQMMRSVRNGRSFSLVLVDVVGFQHVGEDGRRMLPAMARNIRRALGDVDFVARLEGPVFAAILTDDSTVARRKLGALLDALPECVRPDFAGRVLVVASFTGYEGEEDVRAFLRRAQRDLLKAKASAGTTQRAMPDRRERMAS